MASDPTAWWDNEPVLQQAPEAAAVAAAAAPEPAAPRRQKRSGSLANLLGIGGQRAPDPAGPVIPEGLVLVHTGWLTKQGHVVKNWKRRFCRLVINSSTSPRTAQLTYYKTEDLGYDAERAGEQGVVELRGARVEGGSAPGKLDVTVVTAAGKAFPLRAASDDERAVWEMKINECIHVCSAAPAAKEALAPTTSGADGSEDGGASEPAWISGVH